MRWHFPQVAHLTFMALLLGVPIVLGGCEHRERAGSAASNHAGASGEDSIVAEAVALDRQLTEVYLHRDWPALAAIVAPDYYGTGEGFEWDFAALQREFPKIQLSDFHIERQHVKRLAPDLILINDVLTMREIYAGQNISGRYWSGDIWVRRDGRWLLLVEQEVPLR